MSKLFLQVFDARQKKLAELVSPHTKAIVTANGYDYKLVETQGAGVWGKVSSARTFLAEYDEVYVMDLDCVIKIPSEFMPTCGDKDYMFATLTLGHTPEKKVIIRATTAVCGFTKIGIIDEMLKLRAKYPHSDDHALWEVIDKHSVRLLDARWNSWGLGLVENPIVRGFHLKTPDDKYNLIKREISNA